MQRAKTTRGEYRIGPGASSLLMIFVCVCMTTLGILMLISAVVDSRIGARSEQHITAYYAGAADVQRELAELDSLIVDARRDAKGDLNALKAELMSFTNEGMNLEVSEINENLLKMQFNVPMNEDNEIDVVVDVPVAFGGPRYSLTRHTARNTTEWNPDFTLDLFMGDFSE